MKNLFKSLMLVAVAAMAFTACQNDVDDVNAVSKGTTITFNASFADETRVSLTDGDQDGVYQAAFEAGDKIVFAAYDQNDNMLDYTEEIILTEEQAANKDLTLTANFESEIGVGSKIKAFVNYYYSDWYGRWETYLNYGYQYAMVDSVDNLNASAELVWNGEEFANIIFKHDNSFGKMTLVADGDVKFESAQITVIDGEGNYKYVNVVDEAQKVNNVFFFALNGEALNVSSMEVYAYDVDDKEYTFVKEFEPNQFHFKKGRVSKFTINKWYVALDMPEVKATPSEDGSEVVFSWEPVDNAAGYEVSVNYNESTFVETTSCKVSLADYNPFETIYVYVQAKAGKDTMFMDSQMANASYTVPISKNAKGDTGFDFVYDQFDEPGTDKHRFYNGNVNEYMLLNFENDITALEAGSYSYEVYDGVVYGADSAFSHPNYDNNYNGKREFWFQDSNVIFVDKAADGKYTITAFCKRWVGNDNHLFKGTWSGKLGAEETLATPTNLSATVQDGDVVVNWASVAKAEGYKVTLGNETKTVNTTTATFENAPAGEWTISVVATAKGYKDSEAATTTVTVEATVAQFTSAEAVAADSSNNFHFVTFTNGKDTAVIKIATRGTTEYKAGHYDQEGNFSDEDYLLLGGYATDNTWNGVNCWPVTMDVVDNGDGTATFTISARENSGNYSQHAGTYTGKINGLTLYGNEPTIPTYVFTSAELQWHKDNWTGINVDLFTSTGDKLHLNFDGCTTANFIPEGPYQIAGTVPAIYTYSYSKVTFAGVEYCLEGGSVIVEEVDGKYRFTMDEVSYGYYNSYTYEYSNLAKFNGSFVGEIEGLILPSEYVAPEPDVVPEFVIPGDGVSYDLDWRYTKLVAGIEPDSNSIKVAQENGLDWTINFNSGLTSIVAGDYKAVQNFSSDTALEVDTFLGGIAYNVGSWFYADDFDNVSINVQKEGDFYCITLIGSGGYECPVSGKYRLVYIGKIQ